ncbi:CYTH domain-containing protein [Rhizobium oryzicola]|uniref:CYTH domain-containing protein n=1 Tax=Rhizobium oryzicola TaxID=1232668 RepID=A0ABT8STY8_9HYPH|nr:CYTH domain-containing protein [Rhizobium oryzicola]MDO1581909.1 CYTH domain-containing protein [Rhizobium oryzicola]
MPKEIERKFLVQSQDWRSQVASSFQFVQGYVAIGEDRSVRVRLIDGQSARLTIKIGRNLLARDEYEYDIPIEHGEDLIRAAIGNVIEKTRYRVPYEGFTWEVDVFQGFYHGLVVAEVELESEDQSPAIPQWIGKEVTGDWRYSNMVMATQDMGKELGHGVYHPPL